jgi:hypothetical protein
VSIGGPGGSVVSNLRRILSAFLYKISLRLPLFIFGDANQADIAIFCWNLVVGGKKTYVKRRWQRIWVV